MIDKLNLANLYYYIGRLSKHTDLDGLVTLKLMLEELNKLQGEKVEISGIAETPDQEISKSDVGKNESKII
jgi:hypothetical protein